MAKDFTEWHEVKSLLEMEESDIYFYEREVWLASLGLNLGREEDGKHEKFLRPIIIIKKFNRDQFWGIPLTSTIKTNPLFGRGFATRESTVEAEAVVLLIISDQRSESIAPMAYNNSMIKIPTTVPEKGFYYHYKHDPAGLVNNYAYEVMGAGCHTEDDCRPEDANLVVYRPLYETASVYKAGKLFDIRPLEMFMESVTKDGVTMPRFRKIAEPEVVAELERIKGEMYG